MHNWQIHDTHSVYETEKKTWVGCGYHIPSVLDRVPEEQWCTCEPRVERDGKSYPPMAEGGFFGGIMKWWNRKDEL
jgi:hypothetical protein